MERVYTIPLRNVKDIKRTIRAPRAIREIKIFLTKHMKASDDGQRLRLSLSSMLRCTDDSEWHSEPENRSPTDTGCGPL